LSIPTHIGWDDVMERELYIIAAPDFADLPRSFSFPTPHFAALLAADTTVTPESTLTAFADTLLQSGCAYFCSWGPGCERVHDLFDAQCLFAPSLIMTTWHADEPLDEALWFLLRSTFPDEAYFDTCRSALAITVADSDSATHIERRLRDIPSLAHDVLSEI
jgi:hypothetical protein